jgi:hypothetical protein
MTNGQHEPQALIYNEDRSFEMQIPFSWVSSEFEDHELKIYVEADLEGSQLFIENKLEPQDW